MKTEKMEFTCNTESCIHWKNGDCSHPAPITIQEHCCIGYEFKGHAFLSGLQSHTFASPERMMEIANNAIDSLGELLNGRMLYDALAGSLKMDDAEILAAGFTTLREFMSKKGSSKE